MTANTVYSTKHGQMQATALDQEMHERTCGYWYTVTTWAATSHVAFRTRRGLDRWLEERGLKLRDELPETPGEYSTTPVIGEYYEASHGEHSPTDDEPHRMIEPASFRNVQPVVITADMSNGRYTLALVSINFDGTRTVHTLNPNVKSRIEPVDSNAAMRALMS